MLEFEQVSIVLGTLVLGVDDDDVAASDLRDAVRPLSRKGREER